MFVTNFLRIIFILAVLRGSKSEGCIPRSYGEGNIVCVCNSTYYDPIPPVQKVDAGKYLIYTTDKEGLRLSKTEGTFESSSWLIPINSMTITSEQRQTIIGFGGAFTDATGYNVKSVGNESADNIMNSYFGVNGIGYTIGRVPIGATDYGLREYSYSDTPDKNLTDFALAPEDFEYKIPLIKQAAALVGDKLKLFASAWSSPTWMKVIDKYATFLGILKEDMCLPWAKYHLKFFQQYAKNNLTFWGVTTGNEPVLGYTFYKIPSVAMGPLQMGKWISECLGPTIRNSEFADIKIMALDDETVFLPIWMNIMYLGYPKSKNYVDGIAIHWYFDRFIPNDFSLESTHAEYPNTFIFGSEGTRGERSGEKDVILGSWERAEDYASYLIQNLLHWVVSWVDWNMALNTAGGPGLYGGAADSPIIVNATSGEFYRQPTFYAMGHFSKFVTPGSKVIKIKQLNIFRKSVAFQRPDGGIVVVIANTGSFDDSFTIVDKNKDRGQISIQIKSHSIVTLLYW